MQHYFSESPDSPHDYERFEAEVMGVKAYFTSDAGVFSKGELDFGSRLLIESSAGFVSGRVLDMGCGWGAVGVFLKLLKPDIDITMADVNSRAVELARQNARANGIEAEVVQSDVYSAVRGEFDFIITNPPIRAGKSVIYRIFDEARERLSPGGCIIIVIRKEQGAPSARTRLEEKYASVELVWRKKGYHILKASV